ncbi:ABC transporter substrate-binding protein [Rhodosalinus sp. FB01]|uniref:ABC transporter substrate-binding protein n=1 Tax=Rhodosalinus sp. FB01 TaxID=3239194 RepID=UPI0035258DDD
MGRRTINFGCWDYDRMVPLIDGRVRADGIDLNFLNLPVEETFFRMLRHQEFDAAEMSLSSYVVSRFRADEPFVAIPAFPSRFFRHCSIYVNANAGIEEPKDLIGKRIGCPEYQMTAPVWIRGILSDEYGVPVDSVTYVTGGEESPNRKEKLNLDLPSSIRVEPIGPDKTLATMLRDGEIDALYTARKPSTYTGRDGSVRRLFEDYEAVERDYFARTGIFPIMHTVVVRRSVVEEAPWVCQSLLKALTQSKDIVLDGLRETAALKASLPWLVAHVEDAERFMGKDFWTYGFEGNRTTIDTFLRYHHEQGLSKTRLKPEEIFAASTMESFVI